MEFNEKLIQFGQRAKQLKNSISTEEATKTSIIMPFFQLLGYDVFNPLEFVPEYTADVGIKKGEKVDYAIMRGGKPAILIECKPCNKKLDKYGSQLFRYFSVTESKFAILTNGIKYNFYTDLDDVNKMDVTPFLEIDITRMTEDDITEFKKFHKVNFDADLLYDSASELKYCRTIKERLQSLYTNPSDEFVKLILSPIYSGMKTQNVIERFRPIVQKSFRDFIANLVNSSMTEKTEAPGEGTLSSDPLKLASLLSAEEGNVFYKIRSILSDVIPAESISYKVTESYLSIIYHNRPRKWICRFSIGSEHILLIVPDHKNIRKIRVQSIDDMDQYSVDLHMAAERLISEKSEDDSLASHIKEDLPTPSCTEAVCGQKTKMSSLSNDSILSVKIDIPKMNECEIDLACFGVDSKNILDDEAYFIFYNQPESENGSIKMSFSDHECPNGFDIDVDLLPKTIQKIVFTAAIDGNCRMSQIDRSLLAISGNQGTLHHPFSGGDFKGEKAVILAEIYRKEEDWIVSIVSAGFNGGLDALLLHYGGTIDE